MSNDVLLPLSISVLFGQFVLLKNKKRLLLSDFRTQVKKQDKTFPKDLNILVLVKQVTYIYNSREQIESNEFTGNVRFSYSLVDTTSNPFIESCTACTFAKSGFV